MNPDLRQALVRKLESGWSLCATVYLGVHRGRHPLSTDCSGLPGVEGNDAGINTRDRGLMSHNAEHCAQA